MLQGSESLLLSLPSFLFTRHVMQCIMKTQRNNQNKCLQCTFLQTTEMLKLLISICCKLRFRFQFHVDTTPCLQTGQRWAQSPLGQSKKKILFWCRIPGSVATKKLPQSLFKNIQWCDLLNCGHWLQRLLTQLQVHHHPSTS